MKKLISRLQKDLAKFQATIQKEGNVLLDKVRKIDLKDNFDHRKQELERLIEGRLKKLEPAYHNLVEELRKSAKKTGIDIDRIEKELKKTAAAARKKLAAHKGQAKGKTKAKTKTTSKKKPSAKASSTTAKPKTTRKKTASKSTT